ncbi:TPA: phosphohydrolase [Candidatus Falkowbacteria bacterium]|nr:phosphohydrolase [Candidatus Falkowbacteria bacterium]
MTKKQIIKKTAKHIKSKLTGEGSGHDWWHVYRVWKNALHIGKHESVDLFVVELAALLHDIADWKFNHGDDNVGPRKAREWLEKSAVDEKVISHVCQIIKDASFKGAGVSTKMKTIEGMVVQDADRLDAIGAIGIGRTFAYGGAKGREMYNPEIKPEKHASFEQYKKNQSHTINHFYEKLLLLKDLMNTKTAKRMARKRHKVMENFLAEFFQEWKGKN